MEHHAGFDRSVDPGEQAEQTALSPIRREGDAHRVADCACGRPSRKPAASMTAWAASCGAEQGRPGRIVSRAASRARRAQSIIPPRLDRRRSDPDAAHQRRVVAGMAAREFEEYGIARFQAAPPHVMCGKPLRGPDETKGSIAIASDPAAVAAASMAAATAFSSLPTVQAASPALSPAWV